MFSIIKDRDKHSYKDKNKNIKHMNEFMLYNMLKIYIHFYYKSTLSSEKMHKIF